MDRKFLIDHRSKIHIQKNMKGWTVQLLTAISDRQTLDGLKKTEKEKGHISLVSTQ